MMDIKENEQVCSIIFFDNKTGSCASVNGELPQELHKPMIRKFERGKVLLGLKIIFGMQM